METKAKTTKSKTTESTALSVPLYNQSGKSSGSVSLPEAIFGLKWNADLVHQVAVSMMANMRAGTAHTKDRSEVSGGGKKPWRQKGTGRARHGSSRSPIWIHGGITFGPRNEKDYSKKINKKMRAKALFVALSRRMHDNQILVLDAITLGAIKTKDAAEILKNLSNIDGFNKLTSKKTTTALIALPEKNEMLEKSFANLPGVTTKLAKDLNVLDVMKSGHLILVNPEVVVGVFEAKIK